MEKTAAKKSIAEIDEILAMSYLSRRKHKELNASQRFFDPSSFASTRYLSSLPEALILGSSGPTHYQMSVYEDFMRINHDTAGRNVQTTVPRQEIVSGVQTNNVENLNSTSNINQSIDKFNAILLDLEKIIRENPNEYLDSFTTSHSLKIAMQNIFRLATQSQFKDECCLIFAEKIINSMYKNNSILAREAYILIIKKLIESSRSLLRELKEWFFYSDDKVFFFNCSKNTTFQSQFPF